MLLPILYVLLACVCFFALGVILVVSNASMAYVPWIMVMTVTCLAPSLLAGIVVGMKLIGK